MNDSSNDPRPADDTFGPGLIESVRRDFVSTLAQSWLGGPTPDPDDYLRAVPAPEREPLRRELLRIAEAFRAGRGPAGNGTEVPGDSAGATPEAPAGPGQDTGAESAEPAGTVEYAAAGPSGPTEVMPVEEAPGGASPSGLSAGRGELPDLPAIAGYEVLGVLGRGAMGVVYKARHRGLKRLVALKMILAGEHVGQRERARFRREAEAIARLAHPNIVQVYEVGEEGGRPFLSLEYVDGGSLDQKIADTPQPPGEAARLVRLLAGAMEAAHREGVIHRDLKPGNVLLTREGIPKVGDFGLARELEAGAGATRSGTVLGTPSYMAPEQADGRAHDVGPPSDVYGLGAVLYELLTGRPPFKGANVWDTIHQVKNQEPVPPGQLQPRVPRDLETVCLKCLQKHPRKRYASAADLAEDLRRFLAGEPILARPVSAPGRLWRWCRRNPRLAALSAAVALLLGTVAVGSTALAWQIKQEKARADASALAERAAHERAEGHAAAARQQFELSLTEMLTLAERVYGQLEKKTAGSDRPDPELVALRQDILRSVQGSMTNLARVLESSGATQFSQAHAHQRLGGLLLKLGQGPEAQRQYERAYELVARAAQAQPDEDRGRGNQALMLSLLGEVTLHLTGDLHAARDRFRQAARLQEDIAAHPRNGFYTPADNRRLLARYYAHLGPASLGVGEAAAARACFEYLRGVRQEAADADPGNQAARSFLAQAFYWLGDAGWRLRDGRATDEHFGRALALCESLARAAPADRSFKADLAEVSGGYGDALVRLGLPEQALSHCEKALGLRKALSASRPGDAGLRASLAAAHDQVGLVLARLGRRAEADGHFHEALRLREQAPVADRAGLALSLARCGRHAEAAGVAAAVRQHRPRDTDALFRIARCYAAGSAAAEDPSTRDRYLAATLGALRAAAAGDYKDLFVLESDPDLEVLLRHPAFRAFLDELRGPGAAGGP
jgi:serine/threonine-protein kinase